jgi:hypothetical protein
MKELFTKIPQSHIHYRLIVHKEVKNKGYNFFSMPLSLMTTHIFIVSNTSRGNKFPLCIISNIIKTRIIQEYKLTKNNCKFIFIDNFSLNKIKPTPKL